MCEKIIVEYAHVVSLESEIEFVFKTKKQWLHYILLVFEGPNFDEIILYFVH